MHAFVFCRRGRLLAPLTAALLAGCATVHPDPVDPSVLPALPERYVDTAAQPLPDRWWRQFGDADLDPLVERALSDNFSLAAARARLRQAQAAARGAGAERAPQVDLRASGSGRRGSDSDASQSWSLGAAASYELDLWGRLESSAEAARLDARASRAQLDAAAISLSAELASAYYSLLELRGEEALLRSQLDTYAKVLELLELRARNGRASADEVLRQRQLIEQTESSLVRVRAQQELTRNRLAVLAGLRPDQLSVPAGAALVEVPPLPTHIPAAWLQRRPDLRQAYLRLQAADARLASAVAAQYPRINLSAGLEGAADNPADLFRGWLGTLAGNIVAPLIDGGRRRAAVEQAEAAREALLQDYGQTILTALREVEDALLAERRDRELLARLQTQSARAEQIVAQLRARYINGSVGYLDVLSALNSQQQLSRDLLAARWALVQDRIALARALAGGWDEAAELPPLTPARARADDR